MGRHENPDSVTPALPPKRLTYKQVAEHWGIDQSTVRRMVAEGQLPCIRIGHSVRIRPEDLLRYENEGPAPWPDEDAQTTDSANAAAETEVISTPAVSTGVMGRGRRGPRSGAEIARQLKSSMRD